MIAVESAAAAEERFFSLTVNGSGQFTQDFGEDRLTGDSRGFGTDGKTEVSWTLKLKAVARLEGEMLRFGRAAKYRRIFSARSSTLEYDHNGPGGSLQEDRHCEQSSITVWTRDRSDGPGDALFGSWVQYPATTSARLTSSGFDVFLPGHFDPYFDCAFHAIPEGLEYVSFGELKFPRGAFNPKFDTDYSESFHDENIEGRDVHYEGCCPHSFHGTSSLEVRVKKIAERSALRQRERYRDEDDYLLSTFN